MDKHPLDKVKREETKEMKLETPPTMPETTLSGTRTPRP